MTISIIKYGLLISAGMNKGTLKIEAEESWSGKTVATANVDIAAIVKCIDAHQPKTKTKEEPLPF